MCFFFLRRPSLRARIRFYFFIIYNIIVFKLPRRSFSQSFFFLGVDKSPPVCYTIFRRKAAWCHGSVGRAHRSHRWGHRFESCCDHQQSNLVKQVAFFMFRNLKDPTNRTRSAGSEWESGGLPEPALTELASESRVLLRPPAKQLEKTSCFFIFF